jgi:hypothetical protein
METEERTDSIHTVEKDNIRPPPHYYPERGPQIITSDTARQGPMGRRVLVLLVATLACRRRESHARAIADATDGIRHLIDSGGEHEKALPQATRAAGLSYTDALSGERGQVDGSANPAGPANH